MTQTFTFLVVDNDEAEVLTLQKLLRKGFVGASVLPDRNHLTFASWLPAVSYLKEVSGDPVIAFLDLGLSEEDSADASRGLREGAHIRELRPDWVLIAFTRFGSAVRTSPLFRDVFDGIIDKFELDTLQAGSAEDECIRFVTNAVDAATLKRNRGNELGMFADRLTVVDSMGMRLFRAAFGDESLAEILKREAGDWLYFTVRTLTSGYSGALILSLRGSSVRGIESVVLKVVKSEDIIKDELRARLKYLNQLGPLEPRLVTLNPESVRLFTGAGYYYRQAQVDGEPLLDLLVDGAWKANKSILKGPVSLCVEVLKRGDPTQANIVATTALPLTPLDVGRLETSIRFAADIGANVQMRGFWPHFLPSPDELATDVLNDAKSWPILCKDLVIPRIVQHGDLNPTNIMVNNNEFRLIDLSRLGHWPWGYDLSRLALMLRLRLMSRKRRADWFPDDFLLWMSEPVANIDDELSPEESVCPESTYCDQSFRKFVDSISPQYQPSVLLAYRLATLWDLTRVISYQDASPFKRLWALAQYWTTARAVKSVTHI